MYLHKVSQESFSFLVCNETFKSKDILAQGCIIIYSNPV